MHVAAVIKRKGSDVVTIASDQTIAEAVNVLTERRIGALLVMDGNDAAIAVAHFAAMIEGIADGLYRGEFDLSLDYARDKESPDRNHGESTIYGQSNKR